MKKFLALSWVRAALAILVFLVVAWLLRLALWSAPLALLGVWAAGAIAAIALLSRLAQRSLTLAGLRVARGVLVTIAFVGAFLFFFGGSDVRDYIGERHVQGYVHFRREPELDDNGNPYYPGDGWRAPSSGGRFAVHCIEWSLLGAVIVFPVIAWQVTAAAIRMKERTLLYRSDGTTVEQYETRSS